MKALKKSPPKLAFLTSGMTETTAKAHAKRVTARTVDATIDELAAGRVLRVNGKMPPEPGKKWPAVSVSFYPEILREIDALCGADNKTALYNVLLKTALDYYKKNPQVLDVNEFFGGK